VGLLKNGSYPGQHLSQIVSWMERHQGRALASQKATEYSTLARQALEKLPGGKARNDLSELVDFLMEREK